MSEREPELGLGIVEKAEAGRVAVAFPATGEKRLYALGATVLKRVRFRPGESVATRDGATLLVESVEEENGLLVYLGEGKRLREDAISDVAGAGSPVERLFAGQTDPGAVFALRLQALQARARFRQSEVRGFLGGRIDLIPHQFYILREVSARQVPRVLLADEVGLGKTIEACLIVQRLLAIGRARRVLILVPESLLHQWFVELLRRFNLWFTLYDEPRCAALEESEPGKNPFLSSQLALASVTFLAHQETRRAQALAAGWDLVAVDEAHHLAWSPAAVSPEYALVEALAHASPGLLLLTATPTQLGLAGHFARLRLLDPHRYADYDRFLEEAERYGAVAETVERIVEQKPLKPKDHALLKRLFTRDPERLAQHLEALDQAKPGARPALIRTLLDQHGPGRVVFRNTRAALAGFPKRQYRPAPIAGASAALLARSAREMRAEESGDLAGLRYSFKENPRVDWLVAFLQELRPAKVLLICKSQRKVLALEAALKEKTSLKIALFHEGLPLVQRDRQAAWFAEPEGAQLLICSEIGSEGRNFQFAHHLVLLDLPLNPGLLEQRIGRLDRIGQTETIRVHVPFLAGSAEEAAADWCHRGLDAFEQPLQGGEEYLEAFRARLLEAALAWAEESSPRARAALDELVAETAAFRARLATKLRKGRDRLLELNSFDPEAAAGVVERVRAADADPFPRAFLLGLLDHFGVRVKEFEEGELFLDPSHAYVESFPSLPADGMLATFDRRRAIAREDIRFLSADHALFRDAIDLLVDSPAGTTAFCRLEADTPNLLLEAVFVLETVADSRWQVDQFLAPTPVRVLLDLRGRDLTDERSSESLSAEVEEEEADLHRFLERPGFDAAVLKTLVAAAMERAEERGRALKAAAEVRATTALTEELERLRDLQKRNDHIRPEEVTLAAEQRARVREAVAQARLRFDSLRLILEGPLDEE